MKFPLLLSWFSLHWKIRGMMLLRKGVYKTKHEETLMMKIKELPNL